jgi:hypothetical protein
MYRPMRHTGDYSAMNLVVRTVLPANRLAAGVRTALRPVDPNLPVRDFCNARLVVASPGIYAVISYSVNQRVQEIGIRMALSASATDLQSRILLHTLGLAAVWPVLGRAPSRVLTSALASMLFGVAPGDPVTFMAMGALLVAVAAVAGYFPRSQSFANRSDGGVAGELSALLTGGPIGRAIAEDRNVPGRIRASWSRRSSIL